MSKKRPKDQLENFTGGFLRIPHAVFDSNAFTGSTDRAKSLLIAVARQLNGKNNGRLQLTDKWLAVAGYRSKRSNKVTQGELIERGLIVQTKRGGLNIGCSWYAVTWLPISNYVGLDVSPGSYHQGAWADCKLPPTERRQPPAKEDNSPHHEGSKNKDSALTTRAVLPSPRGQTPLVTTLTMRAEKAIFDHSTTLTVRDNVSIPSVVHSSRGSEV